MVFEAFTKNLENILEDLKSYCNSSIKYYKLKVLKKIVNAISSTIKVLLCMVLLIFLIFFFSIAAGILIGRCMDSYVCGFFIVGLFYSLLLLIVILFGKMMIRRPLRKRLAKKMFSKESRKNED